MSLKPPERRPPWLQRHCNKLLHQSGPSSLFSPAAPDWTFRQTGAGYYWGITYKISSVRWATQLTQVKMCPAQPNSDCAVYWYSLVPAGEKHNSSDVRHWLLRWFSLHLLQEQAVASVLNILLEASSWLPLTLVRGVMATGFRFRLISPRTELTASLTNICFLKYLDYCWFKKVWKFRSSIWYEITINISVRLINLVFPFLYAHNSGL